MLYVLVFLVFSRSSRNFGEDLEDPRSDRIYSSGTPGVKKGPGPQGTSYEEISRAIPKSAIKKLSIFHSLY